jgi:hypothetical protein
MSAMAARNVELKLPPVEAFTFKGIMEEIKHGVAEDLERIAEICARSKYSLSNQYEVHVSLVLLLTLLFLRGQRKF